MSTVHYDAHPSLVRMRPFGTLLAVLAIVAGFVIVALGANLVPGGLPQGVTDQAIKTGGAVLFALGLLVLFVWYVATRTDHLVIKDDEIVWTHGIFSRRYTEIGLSSVRTVRVDQTLLQRMMDAGDVSVFTAGDTPELTIRGLPAPGRIRELVKGKSPVEA